MPKTKFERELEQKPQSELIAFCDIRGLDHTGDREALIARLVAYEKAQTTEPEPEVETPAAEPEAETEPEPEPVVESVVEPETPPEEE